MQAASGLYFSVAILVLFLHALFILWVVFGALVTRSRPVLRWLHIASLVWGILTELLPWPCPLTVLENWLEVKAGAQPVWNAPLDIHAIKPRSRTIGIPREVQ